MATKDELREVVREEARAAVREEAARAVWGYRRSDDERDMGSQQTSGGLRVDELSDPHQKDLVRQVDAIHDAVVTDEERGDCGRRGGAPDERDGRGRTAACSHAH